MTVVGLSLPVSPADGPVETRLLREAARRADRAGFAGVSCGDHLLWHAAMLDPFVTLGMLAGVTERISLFTGLALAPIRHPLWLAKQAGSLAALSEGRLVLGLGAGGEEPEEFAAVGVDPAYRGRLTTESAELVRTLLGGRSEPTWGELALTPRLARRVPLWFGGHADGSLLRAARLGDGWLGLMLTPERFVVARDRLQELAAGVPRRGHPVRCGVLLVVCVDDSVGRARARAERSVRGHWGRDDDRILERVVAGPAELAAGAVGALAAAGADLVQLHLVGDDPLSAIDALADALAAFLPSTPLHLLAQP